MKDMSNLEKQSMYLKAIKGFMNFLKSYEKFFTEDEYNRFMNISAYCISLGINDYSNVEVTDDANLTEKYHKLCIMLYNFCDETFGESALDSSIGQK